MFYSYDTEQKTLHTIECKSEKETHCLIKMNIKQIIAKKIKTCKCCQKEFSRQLIDYNKNRISLISDDFVYVEKSKIYHKKGCHCVNRSRKIASDNSAEMLVELGRRPCKLCKPFEPKFLHIFGGENKRAVKNMLVKKFVLKNDGKTKKNLSLHEIMAIKRYNQAKEDLLYAYQSGMQIDNDVLTKNHSSYAFWAGAGYKTFHTYGCKKLQGMTNIKGFSHYSHACSAGYKPCKDCKPSAKSNLEYSIPLKSRARSNEDNTHIENLCKNFGYKYNYETETFFSFETQAGVWKIDLTAMPYHVKHLNTAKNSGNPTLHEQPRLFLSKSDVILYVKRHDESLVKSLGGAYQQQVVFN